MKNPFSKKATKEAKPVAPEPPKVLTADERESAVNELIAEALGRIRKEYGVVAYQINAEWTFKPEGLALSVSHYYVRVIENRNK